MLFAVYLESIGKLYTPQTMHCFLVEFAICSPALMCQMFESECNTLAAIPTATARAQCVSLNRLGLKMGVLQNCDETFVVSKFFSENTPKRSDECLLMLC